MKTCKDCEQTLPAEAFVPNPKGRGGLQPYCRKCQAARSRAWAAANREANLARKRAYYEENKQALLTQQKAYYEANKQRILEAQRKTPQENRAHVKAWVQANPDKRREMLRSQRERLLDSYVRRRLVDGTTLKPAEIPQGLIDAKREQLRILRELRKDDHEER